MRLLEYLNENTLNFNKIQRSCKTFLNDLRRMGTVPGLLMSGRKGKPPFFQGKVRKDRRPKDTPDEIHNMLDNYFEEFFGVRPRSNSIFVTSKRDIAGDYGDPYFIFPIRDYTIIWSDRITDLFGDIIENNDEITSPNDVPEYVFDEYWARFGENEEGNWVYNGKKYDSDKEEALESIIDHEFDEEEITQDEIEDIRDDMEWEPEMTEEEFVDRWREENESRVEDILRDAVSEYEKGNLQGAIESGNEVMLMTNKYYALHYSYRHDIIKWLESLGIKVTGGV